MNPPRLIADIAAGWVQDTGLRSGQQAGPSACCEICGRSDLVFEDVAHRWPHGALHSLVAPIEEVVDTAVEAFLEADRDERISRVDAYRAQLRASARAVVDGAIVRSQERFSLLAR